MNSRRFYPHALSSSGEDLSSGSVRVRFRVIAVPRPRLELPRTGANETRTETDGRIGPAVIAARQVVRRPWLQRGSAGVIWAVLACDGRLADSRGCIVPCDRCCTSLLYSDRLIRRPWQGVGQPAAELRPPLAPVIPPADRGATTLITEAFDDDGQVVDSVSRNSAEPDEPDRARHSQRDCWENTQTLRCGGGR